MSGAAPAAPGESLRNRALGAVPYLVLLIGLALTAWAWWGGRSAQTQLAQSRFEARAAQVVQAIRARLAAHEQILRGGVALFAASDKVTRSDWATYVAGLKLEQNYPGVQGMGVSFRVPAEALDEHVHQVRDDGLPTYSVHPEGARLEYHPVVYIEPFSGRNLQAVGFDLYSDPARAAALDLARDSGQAAITGRLALMQETGGTRPQAGFLMFLPIYAHDEATFSVAERRAALIGHVLAPFRMDDFIGGVLGPWVDDVSLTIYDGAVAAPESLLYDDRPVAQVGMRRATPLFRRVEGLAVGGRRWTLQMQTAPAFEAAIDRRAQILVVIGGVLLSLALFLLARAQNSARARAWREAEFAAARLKATEERLTLAEHSAVDGLWDWNIATGQVYYSPRWKAQIGYREEEIGSSFAEFETRVHPDDLGRVKAALKAHLEDGTTYALDFRLRAKDGSYRWIRARGNVIRDASGKALRMTGSHLDISDYRAQQEAIERLNAELESRVAERTAELARANAELEREIAERRRAEAELKQVNEELSASMARMEHYTREITLLGELGDLLRTCKTTAEAYGIVGKYGLTLFDGTGGGLFMITPSRNLVDAASSWGRLPAEDNIFAPDDCWALRRGKTNLDEPGRGGLHCAHVSAAGSVAALCVPLVAHGETMGVLHLRAGGDAESAHRLEDTVHLAEAVAEHVGLAIATLQLRDSLRTQSIRDPLTGLFNRRYMEETLQREERRAVRAGSSIGVIMLDIDHFKAINDTYSHTTGDVYLKELATVITRHTREGDIACRYGGEEFVIIMPGANLEATAERAEELRRGAADIEVELQGREAPRISISAGVAAFPRHGPSWEEVLARADEALYRAKQAGRNRVVVAE